MNKTSEPTFTFVGFGDRVLPERHSAGRGHDLHHHCQWQRNRRRPHLSRPIRFSRATFTLRQPEKAETPPKFSPTSSGATALTPTKRALKRISPVSAAATAELLTTVEQARAFAKKIAPFLSDVHTDCSTKDGSGNYVISGLSAGYYLVKDKDNTLTGANDFYTAYLMKVVANVTATPKGEKPTLEKQIQNNNTGEWSTTGNVAFQLGDTVNFRIITSVPDVSRYPNGYTYIVHDTMTVGFTSKVTADAASVSIVIDNNPTDTLAGELLHDCA